MKQLLLGITILISIFLFGDYLLEVPLIGFFLAMTLVIVLLLSVDLIWSGIKELGSKIEDWDWRR